MTHRELQVAERRARKRDRNLVKARRVREENRRLRAIDEREDKRARLREIRRQEREAWKAYRRAFSQARRFLRRVTWTEAEEEAWRQVELAHARVNAVKTAFRRLRDELGAAR